MPGCGKSFFVSFVPMPVLAVAETGVACFISATCYNSLIGLTATLLCRDHEAFAPRVSWHAPD
jgi:hypothetical protein